jgi:choline dehydrogenase-like flavoprotein
VNWQRRATQVLLLERGGSMALTDQNVADVDLFRKNRYHPPEQWLGTDGDPFSPQMVYALGGNTKIWGAVLQRLREDDFTGRALEEGPAPDWELRYGDLEPWYDRAEALYRVHGKAGADPSDPHRHGDYPYAPLPVEPLLEDLRQGLERRSLHPYPLPLSWSTLQENPTGDAETFGVDRALAAGNPYTLRRGAEVRALHVNASGNEVKGVEAVIDGQSWLFMAHQVVLAAGAVNTPAILLRSSSDRHPHGLANGSDQVGRNLMKPQLTSILQRSSAPAPAATAAAWESATTTGAIRTSITAWARSRRAAACCRIPCSPNRRRCCRWSPGCCPTAASKTWPPARCAGGR